MAGRVVVATMFGLERNDGSDRGLHEGVRERTRELMNGFPTGAVRRQETADTRDDEGVNCRGDDRLEDSTGQMQAADEARDALHPGKPLGVTQHVHAPAWEQPETMTRPLFLTLTITFWSSQIIGSSSQPASERA
jgi:hypothetical protein